MIDCCKTLWRKGEVCFVLFFSCKITSKDGFTASFPNVLGGTQVYYHVLHQGIFSRKTLQSANHTWITRVPKKPIASKLADFDPISISNHTWITIVPKSHNPQKFLISDLFHVQADYQDLSQKDLGSG